MPDPREGKIVAAIREFLRHFGSHRPYPHLWLNFNIAEAIVRERSSRYAGSIIIIEGYRWTSMRH